MTSFLSRIIDLLLPPRCICCGKIVSGADGLCAECFNEVSFITKPYCTKCGHPFDEVPDGRQMLCGTCLRKTRTPFRLSRSALRYDEFSKNMLLSFKFMDKTENAPVFAKWLKLAGTDIFKEGVDLIVPVPLHFTRLLKRRYNQSALIARELGKLTGIKVDYTSVIRHRRTKPQVQFSGHARISNVKNAFSVRHPERLKNKRIVLIDDVMTTGSTLKECALAMKKAGVKSVDTLTVARVC